MSVLRSLSGEYRTWRGQRVWVEIDPTETSARISGSSSEARFRPYESARLRRTLLPIERGANMRRREFLGILGSSVAVWPLAARAQRAALGCHELVEGGLNVNRGE